MTASADQRSFRLTSFIWSALLRFFDGSKDRLVAARAQLPDRIDWARSLPFVLMHLACLAAFLTGVSPVAIVVALIAYLVRMFAITGFYHRYFSHRTFKTSRVGQFVFGLLGASAVQRGPVWWAAHHRHHHANSDREADVHSPS
jgi:stearoyl-CoA desaturase (delta-9 desaturase)